MSKKTNMNPFDPSAGRKNRIVPITKVAELVTKRTGTLPLKKDNPELTLKFAWVDPKDIYINYDRQRYPEPTHIKKLSTKWKTYVMTPAQARKDSSGRYNIADGQQHTVTYISMYPDALVPVFYVESDDENVESEMLLALNCDQQPMAKYFIHEQHCKMGDKHAINIEETVRRAECSTGYKVSKPGSITHISDLYNAVDDYGYDDVYEVLTKYRLWWANENIKTATMIGFLKVKSLMVEDKVYTEELFDDVFAECAAYFQSADRLHLDIKDEFVVAYPTNYRGMGVKEKVASGIINVYEKRTRKPLVNMPFDIDMPMIDQEA
jgi:hypothetical protein